MYCIIFHTMLYIPVLLLLNKHSFIPDDGCSEFMTVETCESGCGYGAANGRCHWRRNNSSASVSSDYETCSPFLSTCPDRRCDELETLVPRLCPQDCTGESHDDGSIRRLVPFSYSCCCSSCSSCSTCSSCSSCSSCFLVFLLFLFTCSSCSTWYSCSSCPSCSACSFSSSSFILLHLPVLRFVFRFAVLILLVLIALLPDLLLLLLVLLLVHLLVLLLPVFLRFVFLLMRVCLYIIQPSF